MKAHATFDLDRFMHDVEVAMEKRFNGRPWGGWAEHHYGVEPTALSRSRHGRAKLSVANAVQLARAASLDLTTYVSDSPDGIAKEWMWTHEA
jgi:hypothetical protein